MFVVSYRFFFGLLLLDLRIKKTNKQKTVEVVFFFLLFLQSIPNLFLKKLFFYLAGLQFSLTAPLAVALVQLNFTRIIKQSGMKSLKKLDRCFKDENASKLKPKRMLCFCRLLCLNLLAWPFHKISLLAWPQKIN